ncbi:MAG: aminopeptidase P family protein [Bacteroidaceae bacterium]
MKQDITLRVEALRSYMRKHALEAFIFPSTDPHNGEYIPRHWMTREWISGFNGSAGTAVVTLDDAALWTDSRYFLAAEEQLANTPFRLMKDRLPETPTITEWLCQNLKSGQTVGIDGWVNSIAQTESLRQALQSSGIILDTRMDPAEELWENRPSIPMNAVEIQPLRFAGESATSKLTRIRKRLKEVGADMTVICPLDEIAWITNLRGTDVHCNPVFVSYMAITQESAILYVDSRKLSQEVYAYLSQEGIATQPYEALPDALAQTVPCTLLIDPASCNCHMLPPEGKGWRIIRGDSLISPMKAIKNEAEQEGFRQAMRHDGVAMVKFLRWLKPAVEAGGQTEISVDEYLTSLRAEQPLYREISFDTIAGYAQHGAIVHYEATEETDMALKPGGLLLLDSGAQYQNGTTDITRTIPLGPLTQEERLDYTLVLKGHIRLAMVKFPVGTCGTQLDVLARYAMWQQGINYGHGTGHGVGSYLCVHEGPHQIRMNHMPAPLMPGMTVTNEPGIYRAGKHGVRIENTMIVKEWMESEFGQFLQLYPLTLCPIDMEPVLWDMMQEDEVTYLNEYHARVRRELAPLLDGEDLDWLIKATEQHII